MSTSITSNAKCFSCVCGRAACLRLLSRAGNLLIGFLSELLVFCEKISESAICSKNEQLAHSLIFGDRPERFAHGCSFLVSDLSELLMVAH